jgi:hypothetical protein
VHFDGGHEAVIQVDGHVAEVLHGSLPLPTAPGRLPGQAGKLSGYRSPSKCPWHGHDVSVRRAGAFVPLASVDPVSQ